MFGEKSQSPAYTSGLRAAELEFHYLGLQGDDPEGAWGECLRGDSGIPKAAGTRYPAAGLRPKRGRPPTNSRDWGGPRGGPGLRASPGTPISVRATSQRRAPPGAPHTRRPALTAQVVGPLVQHALHGACRPLTAPARCGDTGPASHPGPGGGVTATA